MGISPEPALSPAQHALILGQSKSKFDESAHAQAIFGTCHTVRQVPSLARVKKGS